MALEATMASISLLVTESFFAAILWKASYTEIWSSSESSGGYTWDFDCDQGNWRNSMKVLDYQVRACLAF